MKRFISVLLLVAIVFAGNVNAFAYSGEFSKGVNIPISAEISEGIEAFVAHADGSVSTIKPEITLEQIPNTARSADGPMYVLSVRAVGSREYGETETSGEMDAEIFIRITYYNKNGRCLEKVYIEYTAGSGVQLYNREYHYGSDATNGTVKKSPSNFSKNTFSASPTIYSGIGSHVFAAASCDLESWGSQDHLYLYVRNPD